MAKAPLSVAAIFARTQCLDDRHLLDGVAQSRDRYVIRPTVNPDRSCVWDTERDAVVFGAEDLTKDQAAETARRLNDAYRRSRSRRHSSAEEGGQ